MYHLQTIDPKPYQLLQELMTNRDLEKAGFLLCGGGALALHLGHRQSTDIDLFTPKAIPADAMKKFMEQTYGTRVDVYSQSDLGIRGFIDGVKFDMIRFPYQMQHAPLTEQNIRFLDLKDAVAMKVHAVANRGLRRDFYDLAEILQRMPLKDVLANYQQQFTPSPMAMAHTRRALTFFTDAETDSTKVDVRNGRSWDQVKKIMERVVRHPAELPALRAPQSPKPQNPHLAPATQTTQARPLTKPAGSTSPKAVPTASKTAARYRH